MKIRTLFSGITSAPSHLLTRIALEAMTGALRHANAQIVKQRDMITMLRGEVVSLTRGTNAGAAVEALNEVIDNARRVIMARDEETLPGAIAHRMQAWADEAKRLSTIAQDAQKETYAIRDQLGTYERLGVDGLVWRTLHGEVGESVLAASIRVMREYQAYVDKCAELEGAKATLATRVIDLERDLVAANASLNESQEETIAIAEQVKAAEVLHEAGRELAARVDELEAELVKTRAERDTITLERDEARRKLFPMQRGSSEVGS